LSVKGLSVAKLPLTDKTVDYHESVQPLVVGNLMKSDTHLEARKRLAWVQLYEETHDAGVVCNRCGISRPTLRLWLKRYQQFGEAGLQSQSRRPHRSPAVKVTPEYEQWILDLRKRRLGARRIQSELLRLHKVKVSTATIHKVLKRHNISPLRRKRRDRSKRYSRAVPGDRVQVDNMKIQADLFQYTAVDDCTRLRVLALYPSKSAQSSVEFLNQIIKGFPFPVQRIQTDRGPEFFAYEFQDHLRDLHIKFRPNRPASPQLNGKVERSQRTDLDEFYQTIDRDVPDLAERLKVWEIYYNHERPHSSLGNKTPWEKWLELADTVPTPEQVYGNFDVTKEQTQSINYATEMEVRRVRATAKPRQ